MHCTLFEDLPYVTNTDIKLDTDWWDEICKFDILDTSGKTKLEGTAHIQ